MIALIKDFAINVENRLLFDVAGDDSSYFGTGSSIIVRTNVSTII